VYLQIITKQTAFWLTCSTSAWVIAIQTTNPIEVALPRKQVISIGKIEIDDRLFYRVISKSVSQHAIKNLGRERIIGKRFCASFVQRGAH
jgi:hypothetical protein